MGVKFEQGQTPAQAAEEKLGIKDLDMVSQQMAIDYLVPFAVDKRNLCPAFPPNAHHRPGHQARPGLRVQGAGAPEARLRANQLRARVHHRAAEFRRCAGRPAGRQHSLKLRHLREVRCQPAHASGAAKIALEVSQGGKRLDNLSTDGRTYILGMGLMPDGFEKNLIGMTEGDTKEFTFDMPGAPEGEAPLDCKVTVLECQEKHVPEVTTSG